MKKRIRFHHDYIRFFSWNSTIKAIWNSWTDLIHGPDAINWLPLAIKRGKKVWKRRERIHKGHQWRQKKRKREKEKKREEDNKSWKGAPSSLFSQQIKTSENAWIETNWGILYFVNAVSSSLPPRQPHTQGQVLSWRPNAGSITGAVVSIPAHYGIKPGHFETLKIHFPTSEGVCEASERANEWAVRANERTDERVGQYLRLDSCLFQTTVRRFHHRRRYHHTSAGNPDTGTGS